MVSELAKTFISLEHQTKKEHVPETQELLVLEMWIALFDDSAVPVNVGEWIERALHWYENR